MCRLVINIKVLQVSVDDVYLTKSCILFWSGEFLEAEWRRFERNFKVDQVLEKSLLFDHSELGD